MFVSSDIRVVDFNYTICSPNNSANNHKLNMNQKLIKRSKKKKNYQKSTITKKNPNNKKKEHVTYLLNDIKVCHNSPI